MTIPAQRPTAPAGSCFSDVDGWNKYNMDMLAYATALETECAELKAKVSELEAEVNAQEYHIQIAALRDEREKSLDYLELLYDKYENGDSCYEDPQSSTGFLGHAIRLEWEQEKPIADLLNKLRPRQNPSPTPAKEQP